VKSQAMPLKNEPFLLKVSATAVPNGGAGPRGPSRFSPSAVLSKRCVFYFRHAAAAPKGGVCRPRCFLETSGGWPPRLPRYNSFYFRDMQRLLQVEDGRCSGETPPGHPFFPPEWALGAESPEMAPPRRRASVAMAHGASDAPAFPLGRECGGGGRGSSADPPAAGEGDSPGPPMRGGGRDAGGRPSDKFSKAAADGGPMNPGRRASQKRRERGSPAPSTSIG